MERIGYGRVLTLDQNPEAQRDAFTAAGCDRVFVVDHGASGTLARCPELDAALGYTGRGDVLVLTRGPVPATGSPSDPRRTDDPDR